MVDESIIIEQFFSHLRNLGITPKENFYPILDGQTHRFATEDDRSSQKSGAYYIHPDGFVNFGAMDFRKHSCMQKGSISRDYRPKYDKKQYEKAIEESRRRQAERAKQEKEKEAHARVQMMKEFTTYDKERGILFCNTAFVNHPYLIFKGVEGIPFQAALNCNFRVKKNQTSNDDFSQVGDLLIPLVHVDSVYSPKIEERMRDLQIISGRLNHEGEYQKSFYKDISRKGCYCELIPHRCRGNNSLLDLNNVQIIFITEGVATGLSLLALTDFKSPVFCAMSCHNFMNIAQHFHKLFKNIQIIIAADNDYSGLGVKKANEVIEAGYAVNKIIPPEIGQDWNDYYLTIRRA